MKNFLLFSMLVLASVVLGDNESGRLIEDVNDEDPEFQEDTFDWKLSQVIFNRNSSFNVVISPISAKFLLTLLAEAAGQSVPSATREELAKVLPLPGNLNSTREYYRGVLSSLTELQKDITINFGSKGYITDGVSASQKFRAIIEYNYKMKFETIDFSQEAKASQTINSWISDITHGKISNLVNPESLSSAIMVLVNAVYFQGLWDLPFKKTLEKDFFVDQNTELKKEFVEQTDNFNYLFSAEHKLRILQLPYAGKRFLMFVILPSEKDGLSEIVELLSSENVQNFKSLMKSTSVHVQLPKFKIESSIKMKSILKELGINGIFEDSATFPMISSASGTKIKVSALIQKCGIVVDEKGSEAFVATEAELIDKFGGDPREFIADHPFVFFIEDAKTGIKLFSGVVRNPEF